MSSWNERVLGSLEQVREIRAMGRRGDGSLREPVIIWQVIVDGGLYIRSVRGTGGQWYRGVIRHLEGAISWDGQASPVTYIPDSSRDDALDAAYTGKYGSGPSTVAINSAEARATTLRVEPR